MTIPPLKHLGPLLVVWGAAMLMLVFIRDLGSSLMYFGGFLALLYVATNRLSFVSIGLALFAVGAWFFATTVPHVQDRIDIWLDPFKPAVRAGRLPDRAIGCSRRPTAGCSAPASARRCSTARRRPADPARRRPT